MRDTTPTVICIPAKPEVVLASKHQLRVAAYCRVSTDDEEQLTSYEAQKNYYTDKIMTNKEWTMAGIFADEGITGTSARKRPEFLRMIRQCKQGKIDIVLTKSISRFARNTVDCLNYVRALKELGIAVIFEKENMNTLEIDSEILITMLGAFAQSESESISANVRWGIRQAMKEGKATIQYKYLYGYRKGDDSKPEIIPDQAEVVRKIYDLFLSCTPVRGIQEYLNANSVPNINGEPKWARSAIDSILTNEKYCGDVLLQKTYIDDCINKKVKKNTGQLPMYLVQNHHEGIISRETFDAAQAELARRSAGKSPSKKNAPTGRSRYSSKYALSDRLYCGECGTRYQRCTWRNRDGSKRIVWRCVSRVDYGNKYCHDSPTLDEEPLHRAILAAINSAVKDKDNIVYFTAKRRRTRCTVYAHRVRIYQYVASLHGTRGLLRCGRDLRRRGRFGENEGLYKVLKLLDAALGTEDQLAAVIGEDHPIDVLAEDTDRHEVLFLFFLLIPALREQDLIYIIGILRRERFFRYGSGGSGAGQSGFCRLLGLYGFRWLFGLCGFTWGRA